MFIDKDNIAHEDFFVYTFNSDAQYRATLRWFFEICQEAAALHSSLRKVGIPDLLKENKTWVIIREKMHITKYPSFSEKVHVKTGIPYSDSFFAPRSILLTNSDGLELMRSSTMWAVLDVNTRKPVKVTQIYEKSGVVDENSFVDLNLRHLPKLKKNDLTNGTEISVFKPEIFYSDCDINSHVNNIVYIDWALKTLPYEYLMNHRATDVDILWLSEVHIKDNISVKTYRTENNTFNFVMERTSDNTDVCFAQIVFQKAEKMI